MSAGAMDHHHISLRERMHQLADGAAPAFETSRDAVLVDFARVFIDSALFAFDANKHLRNDAFSTLYDCETESRRTEGAPVQRFTAIWTPGWRHDDPLTGFRTGRDSAFVGSTPTVAMPQDERTAALLMLVTSSFVHLSASYRESSPLVQGAVDIGGLDYRFLTLDPAVVVGSEQSRRAGRGRRAPSSTPHG